LQTSLLTLRATKHRENGMSDPSSRIEDWLQVALLTSKVVEIDQAQREDREKLADFGRKSAIFNGAITLSCVDQNSCAERDALGICMQEDLVPELIQGECAFLHLLSRRLRRTNWRDAPLDGIRAS
jgi:hypothetical protein